MLKSFIVAIIGISFGLWFIGLVLGLLGMSLGLIFGVFGGIVGFIVKHPVIVVAAILFVCWKHHDNANVQSK